MWPALTTPFISAISAARADERVEQRQLVRHRGEAVVLDERERDTAPASSGSRQQEHALPGHEHVVEHGERLEHLVLRRRSGTRTRRGRRAEYGET